MKLKVGDRVAIYDSLFYGGRAVREIEDICDGGHIRIPLCGHLFHPAQCRKIVKKKPRRRK